MSTGMIASLVILFFVLARLLPKVKQFDKHLRSNYLGVMCDVLLLFVVPQKSPFYLLILGGWSFSVYAIQFVFRNLSVILQEHWHLALGKLHSTNHLKSNI